MSSRITYKASAPPAYRVVVDLSWLRSASRRDITERLQGCIPVLVPTLRYELSTSSRPQAWTECLEKLIAISSTVVCWPSFGNILSLELEMGRALTLYDIENKCGGLSKDATRALIHRSSRDRRRARRLQDDREIIGADSFAGMIALIAVDLGEDAARVEGRPLEVGLRFMDRFVRNRTLVERTYRLICSRVPEWSLPEVPPESGVWHRWAGAMLAVAVEFRRRRFQLSREVIVNTMNDMDYAILGSFAGGLASSDELQRIMCRALNPHALLL